jgi:hypothetical protein
LSTTTVSSGLTVHKMLRAEDPVEIAMPKPHERAAFPPAGHGESCIEVADVLGAQKLVGLLDALQASYPRFLRRPPLPGAEVLLRASTRLRRVSRDHPHPQLLQCAPDLRQRQRVASMCRIMPGNGRAGTSLAVRSRLALFRHQSGLLQRRFTMCS